MSTNFEETGSLYNNIGIILLIFSFITNLFGDYGFYLTAVGVISFIIGLVIRNRREKNR